MSWNTTMQNIVCRLTSSDPKFLLFFLPLSCVWQSEFYYLCGPIGFVRSSLLCQQPQQRWKRSSPEHVMESTDSSRWSLKTVGFRLTLRFLGSVVTIRICMRWGKIFVLSLQSCCVLQKSLCWEEPDLQPKNGNWNGTVTFCLFWRTPCLRTSSTGWTAPIIRATNGST